MIRIPFDELAENLVGVFDRVVRERETILVERRGNALAILKPVRSAPARRRRKAAADYKAFLSAAGSWKAVDTDRLIAEIYESRRRSSRPAVQL